MFDPAAFKTHRESIAIGNSEHPVSAVASLLARPVPGREDLWYIRTKGDRQTVTFRPADRSLCFYDFSFEEFKKHVSEGTLPNLDIIVVPDTEKWIGNYVVQGLDN